MISNLGKKTLLDVVPLAKDGLTDLATNLATTAASFILDKFERIRSERGTVKAGKEFT